MWAGPGQVKTPLYFRDPDKGYVKITKTVFNKITGLKDSWAK